MSRILIALLSLIVTSQVYATPRTVLLRTDNTVYLQGEVSSRSMTDIQNNLLDLVLLRQKSGKSYPIYLVLDSPGGSIVAGEDFIQFAKTLKNVETITFFAASMASAIVEALPGNRLVVESGTMMFHRAAGGFQGQFENG